jgi:cobalt-zinc-cadmium efflux system outer membrane protein
VHLSLGDNGMEALGLADLEQIALSNNPTLVQAAAQIAGAQGRALQARLYPNPTIGYTGEEIGSDGKAGEHGMFVEQLVVTGGKLRYEHNKYRHEVNQMVWQAQAQQCRVLNGLRMRFYRLLAMDQLIRLRRDLLKIAEEARVTTEELLNVGQANRPDVLQARAEARRQHVALAAAENQYQAAWRELAAFVGQPDLPPLPLAGDLEEPLGEFDWDSTLQHILEASPEIQVALAEVDRNRCGLAREQVEPIPNVNLRGGMQYNYDSEDPQALVEVGLRLPVWDRNQGNIQAARAELGRSQAEVQRVELSIQRRLAHIFNRYQTAQTLLEEYRDNVLPQEREAYQLYLESFRAHRAAWPQVLVAQRTFFQSSAEYIEAQADLRRLEVAMSGLLLVDGLDEPPGPPGEGRVEQSADRQLQDELDRTIRAGEGRGPNERIGNRSDN